MELSEWLGDLGDEQGDVVLARLIGIKLRGLRHQRIPHRGRLKVARLTDRLAKSLFAVFLVIRVLALDEPIGEEHDLVTRTKLLGIFGEGRLWDVTESVATRHQDGKGRLAFLERARLAIEVWEVVTRIGVGDDQALLINHASKAGHDELATGAFVDRVVHDLQDARSSDACALQSPTHIAGRFGSSSNHGSRHTVTRHVADDEQNLIAGQIIHRPPVASALRSWLEVTDHLHRTALDDICGRNQRLLNRPGQLKLFFEDRFGRRLFQQHLQSVGHEVEVLGEEAYFIRRLDLDASGQITARDLIGTLRNAGNGKYDGSFTTNLGPALRITLKSALGGAVSATVPLWPAPDAAALAGVALRVLPGLLAAFPPALVMGVAGLALGWWQWTRFESSSGTFQNLGYALQWPAFAAFCIYAYRKFVVLEENPEPAPSPQRPTEIPADLLPSRPTAASVTADDTAPDARPCAASARATASSSSALKRGRSAWRFGLSDGRSRRRRSSLWRAARLRRPRPPRPARRP